MKAKRIFLWFTLMVISSVLSTVKATTITLADPTIFYENGVFYLTGTNDVSNGFIMYKSTDLVHWTSCGNATGGRALYKDDTFGTGNFWAPQIFKHDGSYYMAYAANELIGIAKSDSPEGPYKQDNIAELPHTTGQIDPYVFIDDDGKKYMYYVRFTGGNMLWVAELTDDFTSIKDNTLTFCLSADDGTWEHTTNVSNTKITEGPTVIKDGGYYYLLYSANDYQDIDYAVGYAYSTSPKGPWTKIGHPFLSRHNIGINGTGHGDLFQDADGNWYYVFHIHASNTAVHSRRTAVVPVTITDDPTNKFIPQVDRMLILDDNAGSGVTFPESPLAFEVDDIKYKFMKNNYVQVDFKDPINFGGYEGDITIPASVDYDGNTYSVYSVGTGAFHNCPNLTSVTLSEGIKQIGVGAFEDCGVEFVDVASTVSTCNYRAFMGCSSLLDVIIRKKTPSNYSTSAFCDETLKDGKLWVPDGSSESYAAHNSWKNFSRISGIEVGTPLYNFVVDSVFYKVTSKEESTCEPIDQTAQYASYRGPLITIPQQVTYNDTVYKITSVGALAFANCRLVENILLPEGITDIKRYAFYNCQRLTEITLPSTTSSILAFAFRGCKRLNSVNCLATTPPSAINDKIFLDDTYANATLYVPTGTKDLYAAATAWKNFTNIVEINTGIEDVQTTEQGIKSDAYYYDLQGRRLSTELPSQRGIYIHQGKKITR